MWIMWTMWITRGKQTKYMWIMWIWVDFSQFCPVIFTYFIIFTKNFWLNRYDTCISGSKIMCLSIRLSGPLGYNPMIWTLGYLGFSLSGHRVAWLLGHRIRSDPRNFRYRAIRTSTYLGVVLSVDLSCYLDIGQFEYLAVWTSSCLIVPLHDGSTDRMTPR